MKVKVIKYKLKAHDGAAVGTAARTVETLATRACKKKNPSLVILTVIAMRYEFKEWLSTGISNFMCYEYLYGNLWNAVS